MKNTLVMRANLKDIIHNERDNDDYLNCHRIIFDNFITEKGKNLSYDYLIIYPLLNSFDQIYMK